MKRLLGVTLLVLFAILSSCKKADSSIAFVEPPITKPELDIVPEQEPKVVLEPKSALDLTVNQATPADEKPEPAVPQSGIFIFIEHCLMGCFSDGGEWISAKENRFRIADLLKPEAYYCYRQNEFISKAEKITIFNRAGYREDLCCIDATPLIPYADDGQEGNSEMVFSLPASIPEELHYIVEMGYNAIADFDIVLAENEYSAPLVISGDFDPLPKAYKNISDTFTQEDISAVSLELKRLGIPGAVPNITGIYEYDFNNDGQMKRVIFAFTPRSESGWLYVTQAEVDTNDSGSYYMVLYQDGSEYDTIVSFCYPYDFGPAHPDDDRFPGEYMSDGIVSIDLAGIYDLNNDGVFELCLVEGLYEGGNYFVYSLNENGTWQRVLTAEFGMLYI